MGRNRLPLKKTDDSYRQKISYSKRRAAIIKKATELSVLCGADVGILMFSPNGELTCFTSNERIEDIFLHYIEQSNVQVGQVGTGNYLYENFKRLKYEREMSEKIARIEALQEKLCELKQQLHEKQEKMRSHNLNLVSINSVHDANVHQQFLINAIRHIEQLKMAILLGEPIDFLKSENIQVPSASTCDSYLTTEELVGSSGNRDPPQEGHQRQEARLPVAPHLSLEFLRTQKHWNLQSSGQGKL